MQEKKEIRQLSLLKKTQVNGLQSKREEREQARKERRVVILLFAATLLLSIIFWLRGNFYFWIADFFGPSTWTFSK